MDAIRAEVCHIESAAAIQDDPAALHDAYESLEAPWVVEAMLAEVQGELIELGLGDETAAAAPDPEARMSPVNPKKPAGPSNPGESSSSDRGMVVAVATFGFGTGTQAYRDPPSAFTFIVAVPPSISVISPFSAPMPWK